LTTKRQIAGIPGLEDDPLWYKDAIIYELHVRAFYDKDNDGIGDFMGLTEKLDYLKDLGITTIWLLPFYPSPLKDDGYDIADYNSVHPSYGTLQDFRTFMKEATRRGLRVITELVINHTSDQHPWFQRARRAEPGNRWRSYYVWSDTPDKYRDARIIFKDFEPSNWSWDHAANAYYWHRFYSHQPDLNFESAQVRRAVLRAMDFWLNMGVSGLRLDAVPYLFEAEGTDCENLPRTHAFLREMRRHMDARFKDRMFLAEANQWPESAADYFGKSDECHMNFHFPVMPRLFMALRMEDRYPIVDILEQTPQIPDNAQWAMFLRNHDELTLEMVTDEERDYMYRSYARDNLMRINLGIRRRLAPLLNNDRRKIELLSGLLFSLPGTPVIYYGDEIGMGDNFYLGDRNGVRTPMQWSPDRNAGFSKANPQSLYFPVVIDPEFHYESINVESQERNSDSLLWWMKRTIAMRKRYKAFGRGSIHFLNPDNRKVLAFVRQYQDETILIVANLSRQAQHAYLDLGEFEGRVPVELSGNTRFPAVTGQPYAVTLGAYTYYWFSLEPQTVERIGAAAAPSADSIPTLSLVRGRDDLFRRATRPILEGVLMGYIRKCRWFGGKSKQIRGIEIKDVVPVPMNGSTAEFVFIEIHYFEGEPETYVIPLAQAGGEDAELIMAESPSFVVTWMQTSDGGKSSTRMLYDAMASETFTNTLLHAMSRPRRFRGEHGELEASHTRAFRGLRGHEDEPLDSTPVRAEQSNTSVMFEDRLIMKLIRRPGDGINPDLEIGRFLTEKARFSSTAPVAGALEYRTQRGGPAATVAILQGLVPNQGDAWAYTLDSLGRYFEWALAHAETEPPVSQKSLLELSHEEVPDLAKEALGFYLNSADLLGLRTAELHTALASEKEDPNFVPEPFSDLYRRSLYQSMRNLTSEVMRGLRRQRRGMPEEAQGEADRLIALEGEILRRFHAVLERRVTGMRTRVHGDYHLGQVLYTGSDFMIIDFEGEPARSLTERRLKRSPLKDVAGMLRSFHYAANAALFGQASTVIRPEDIPQLEQWVMYWYQWVSAVFLKSYFEVASRGAFLPRDREELAALLDIYLLEKAIYEVGYELNNRPAWVRVPMQGVLSILGSVERDEG
jgi:maltose alpha-D-glucosyltransferase/alpha-amylase